MPETRSLPWHKPLLLLFCASQGLAQSASGTVGGAVLDSSRAAIPNAVVTVTDRNSGAVRKMLSTDTGRFLFPGLLPGKYRTSAARPGFKLAVISDIDLQIGQAVELEFVLEIGSMSETLNVEAATTVLQTETAALGQVVADRTIVDLPLNGRNFLQLAALTAGVVPASATTSDANRIGRSETTIHVTGARSGFTSYLIDGQESRGSRFGEAAMLPQPDAILEFKVQRNFSSAEFGGSPGIVSISTKPGTNRFHGSVYEFLRNSVLDSAAYFDAGAPAPFRLNQFGGTLSGPVAAKRSFFFAGYEGRRQRLATQTFARIPAPALLNGDFSRNTPVTDPWNNNAPFPGSVIPANRINTPALNFNQYIPAPNSSDARGNYTGAPSSVNDFDQFHVRIDHRFSESDTVFGRFSKSDWNELTPGLLPYAGSSYPFSSINAVIQETHIVNPYFLNILKVGYTRGLLASQLEPAKENLAARIGFQNLIVSPIDFGLPRMQLTGYTQMGHSINTFRNWTNNYSVSDTLNLIRGPHGLALGGEAGNNRVPQATTNASNGRLTFTGRFTGDSAADYLLGAYSTALAMVSSVVQDFRSYRYALFLQDNYKVTGRLTLNLGLRWEYNQPIRELGGSEAAFDRSIPGLRLASDPRIYGVEITSPYLAVGGLRPGVVKAEFGNFAPRAGFAYKIASGTVLRGGAGIFFATNQQSDLLALGSNPGAALTTSYTNSPGAIPRLASTLFDRVVSMGLPPTTQLSVADANRKNPYLNQVSLSIQQALWTHFSVEVGYVGSQGHQLTGREDLNQAALNAPGASLPVQTRRPYPMFAGIWQFFGGENSNYNGLTASLERRFAGRFGLLANYTFARSMDSTSGLVSDGNSPHQISNNRRLEYGRSAFDARSRFTTSASYELPFRSVLSGWQVNTVLQFQTGLPFSVLLLTDRSNTGTIATQRPNRNGIGNLPAGQRTPDRWFDTGAFVLNPIDTYGNSGRNILDQDGIKSVDLSLLKNSRLTERLLLQFRVEVFNLFDWANFGPPGNYLDGSNFGVITTAGPARQVQFALKLGF